MSSPDLSYGWGKCRPKCLNRCCTAKWALLWISLAGLVQGIMVNGFVNMSISTIEKRFGLKSRQSGLIISAYNIASFFCLVPISFFGGRPKASKPKWLASGVLVMGLGSALYSTPHFICGNYDIPKNMQSICPNNDKECEHLAKQSSQSFVFWLFFFGQLLHGAGATPLFTLGVTYLDENVKRTVSAMYFAIFYGMTSAGPALGFLIGSQLLRIYVDFLKVEPIKAGLTTNSQAWVGAWWIGFVCSSFVCLILAAPIYGMPKTLPDYELVMETKVTETHNSKINTRDVDNNTESKISLVHQFRQHISDLFKNPAFLFLTFAGCCEGLLISAFTSFSSKGIESQYSVSASRAVLLLGMIAIPAAGGGILLGGYLTKRLNPSCSTLLKICTCTIIISCLLTPTLLLKCPNSKFAGINVPYKWNENASQDTTIDLISDCNKNCSCSVTEYFPLCGIDNVIYYSPCHAGCHVNVLKNNLHYYTNCSCIDKIANTCDCEYEAKNTKCEPTCNNLPYFLFLWFFVLLFTFLIAVPGLSATLRVVQFEQRSLALGIQWILVRLCGTIPGPILFGTIIDLGCVLWQKTCFNDQGSCLAYDNSFLSLHLFSIAFVVKIISIIMAFLAWYLYIPPIIS